MRTVVSAGLALLFAGAGLANLQGNADAALDPNPAAAVADIQPDQRGSDLSTADLPAADIWSRGNAVNSLFALSAIDPAAAWFIPHDRGLPADPWQPVAAPQAAEEAPSAPPAVSKPRIVEESPAMVPPDRKNPRVEIAPRSRRVERTIPKGSYIRFEANALAPLAHTRFCLQYRSDCTASKLTFRGGPIQMTSDRWAELEKINVAVNRSIVPERNLEGLRGEKWLIAPARGDCNDYAVTKRHELLMRGWPARALLLAEVVTTWGEHHLILVVRTTEGDVVADNLRDTIASWSHAPYQWVRVQSPRNPKFWSTITRAAV